MRSYKLYILPSFLPSALVSPRTLLIEKRVTDLTEKCSDFIGAKQGYHIERCIGRGVFAVGKVLAEMRFSSTEVPRRKDSPGLWKPSLWIEAFDLAVFPWPKCSTQVLN